MQRDRLNNIVLLRCIAIIIVVLGHSIILYSSEWSLFETEYSLPCLDVVKKIINLFQLPLFFSISGYLINKSNEYSLKNCILKKSKRLLVPYLFCALLWMIPIRCVIDYRWQIGNDISWWKALCKIIILGNDNGHLWYLPTLFLCFVCNYLMDYIHKKSLETVAFILSSMFYIMSVAVCPISWINTFFNIIVGLYWENGLEIKNIHLALEILSE